MKTHVCFVAAVLWMAAGFLSLASCQTNSPGQSAPLAAAASSQPAATTPGGRGYRLADTLPNPGPAHTMASVNIAPNVFNVRNYGAKGDGKTLDSPAINKAIDAAVAAGGGTVLLPGGTYLSGSIHMKSNINLQLDSGSTLLGAPRNSPAYDPAETFVGAQYQDGGHTYFHNSLIWGENLTNVAITGQGLIDGGGLTRNDSRAVGEPGIDTGDKAIALKLCKNVLIRDITMFHGGHFAILVTGCDIMTIDNVTIDTNRDGIDIDCCRNTTVSNCRVNSPGDDAICPKSTYALGRNVITENLTITNCQVSGFDEGTLLDGRMLPSRVKNGRIKFGTESNGGFRNCTVSNCTFRACRGFALEEVDGGILENITVNNLTMMDCDQYAIYIRLGARNRAPAGTKNGICRNIIISNVIATGIGAEANATSGQPGPNGGIQILGMPGFPIENVRLDNIRLEFRGGGTKEQAARVPYELITSYPEPGRWGIMPSYALYARHVKGLEITHANFSFEKNEQRHPIMCVDVDGLEFDHVKAQAADGVPTAKLEAVKGLAVESSPALAQDKIQISETENKPGPDPVIPEPGRGAVGNGANPNNPPGGRRGN